MATIAVALFTALNWALNSKLDSKLAPLGYKINSLEKEVHETREEQKAQSARTDHLYQISVQLLRSKREIEESAK